MIILGRVKVLGARVTDVKTKYWASLEIDKDIMDAAGLYEYEKVLVVNIDNGERFETYVKSAPSKSGRVLLAGGAAKLGKVGDEIGLLVFSVIPEKLAKNWKLKVVHLHENNKIKNIELGDPTTWD